MHQADDFSSVSRSKFTAYVGVSITRELSMNQIVSNIKEETKQPLNIVASIITIINFIGSIAAFNVVGGVPEQAIPVGSVEIGFILACLLEALLAAAFGWAIVGVVSKGAGLPVLLAIVLMLVSAWTSLFNAQWLVLGSAPQTPGDATVLAAISAFFCGFACYLIGGHVKTLHIRLSSMNDFIKSINEEGGLYFWQIASFILMYILIVSQANIEW